MAADAGDVTRAVADIETEVAGRRRDSKYPAALVTSLETPFVLNPAVAEDLMQIDGWQPAAGDRAKPTVFARRVVRRLLGWMVTPVAQQQTAFNTAIVREHRELERRLRRLETDYSAAAPQDIDTAARAAAIATALTPTPTGPIHVFADDPQLGPALAATLPNATVIHHTGKAPADLLDAQAPGSLGAVVIAGVMARMAAAEAAQTVLSAAAAVSNGGAVVIDAPAIEPTDIRMHALAPQAAAVLLTGAGLLTGDAITVGGPAQWYALAARRA